MSAVARPTLFVVASLLVNRATANNDDDDDESNEHLSYAVWIACGLFVILFLLFDLLRTRMWWVYDRRRPEAVCEKLVQKRSGSVINHVNSWNLLGSIT